MALSVTVSYSDRIRAAISDSGPSNLATFVEHTEGWRRGLQRAEFGDERDPKVREFMERTAPLYNAEKIKKPLLILNVRRDRTGSSTSPHITGRCSRLMQSPMRLAVEPPFAQP